MVTVLSIVVLDDSGLRRFYKIFLFLCRTSLASDFFSQWREVFQFLPIMTKIHKVSLTICK